jgi:hypothetical protein
MGLLLPISFSVVLGGALAFAVSDGPHTRFKRTMEFWLLMPAVLIYGGILAVRLSRLERGSPVLATLLILFTAAVLESIVVSLIGIMRLLQDRAYRSRRNIFLIAAPGSILYGFIFMLTFGF